MSLQSTVGLARPKTRSLRATIPEGIVAFLDLKESEKIDWYMQIDEKGERFVIVRKSKPQQAQNTGKSTKRR